MIISKLDAAMHQLNLAIKLFIAGDFLGSLTLAGAAEDILGGLCKAAGKPVSADSIADYHEKDVDPSVPTEKRRGVVLAVLNRARNAAKHASRADENTIDIDQIHPLQMLMRAIPMCISLGVKASDENKDPRRKRRGIFRTKPVARPREAFCRTLVGNEHTALSCSHHHADLPCVPSTHLSKIPLPTVSSSLAGNASTLLAPSGFLSTSLPLSHCT